jgi:hypothetical protein
MTYTKPTVKLIGENGNAFNILGQTIKALKKAKVDQETIDTYLQEAKAGDYDNLLAVTMKYVDVV